MTNIDYIILAVFLVFSLIGFFRGFFVEILSLGKWIIAIIVAYIFYKPVADYFLSLLKENGFSFGDGIPGIEILELYVVQIIAFVLIWFIVRIVIGILMNILKLINEIPIIGFISRVGGAVIGFIKGYVLVFIIILVISLPIFKNPLEPDSQIYSWIEDNTPIISNYVMNETNFMPEIHNFMTMTEEEKREILPELIGNMIENNHLTMDDIVNTILKYTDGNEDLEMKETLPPHAMYEYFLSNKDALAELLENEEITMDSLIGYFEESGLTAEEIEAFKNGVE